MEVIVKNTRIELPEINSRRVLRTKLRDIEKRYENCDYVFYKREGKDGWLGRGKVAFQDGTVVFVRYGGVFNRALPNRLNKMKTYIQAPVINENVPEMQIVPHSKIKTNDKIEYNSQALINGLKLLLSADQSG